MNVVVSSQWRASCNRRRSRNVTFDKHGLHLHETDWYLTINFNEADACKDKILQEVHIDTLLWQQHMITEVTCSADLCTWGISNIAANWNTDHLIGERESHRTGCDCDTCWHVISLWKCTLETCTGSSRLCMRKHFTIRKETFGGWNELNKKCCTRPSLSLSWSLIPGHLLYLTSK